MALHVSPGVYTKIIDLSTYTQEIPSSGAFIAFFSDSGYDNKLVRIDSLKDFMEIYGKPNINSYGRYSQGMYVAYNHIRNSPLCYVIRCLPSDATYSNLVVYLNKYDIQTARIRTRHYNNLYSVSDLDNRINISFDGEEVTSPLIFVRCMTSEDLSLRYNLMPLTDDDGNKVDLRVGDYIASISNSNIFIVTPSGAPWKVYGATYRLVNNTNTIRGMVNIESNSDEIVLNDGTKDIIDLTKLNNNDLLINLYDKSIYAYNQQTKTALKVLGSTDLNQKDTFLVIYTFLGSPDPETGIIPAVVETKYYSYIGSDFIVTTSYKFLPSGTYVIVDYDLTKSEYLESNTQYLVNNNLVFEEFNDNIGIRYPLLLFYPIGRGHFYNEYGISMLRNPKSTNKMHYIVNIWKTQESSQEDSIIESFEVSLDPNDVSNEGDSLYIEDVINTYSKHIRVKGNVDNLLFLKNNTNVDVEFGSISIPIHLYGGSDGSLLLLNSNSGIWYVNDSVARSLLRSAYLGLLDDKILDVDDLYIPIVYDAGYPTEVKDAIVTLVRDIRLDGIALLDNLDNKTYQESIDRRSNHHNYNTRYVAIFEPYMKVFDDFTGKDIWITPLYKIAELITRNDKLYDIWYPFAGINRGTIDGIKDIRFSPRLEQRDTMYLQQLNPVVKFSNGYVLWGNLTAQFVPSALQDIHTMRTVLYIKKTLELNLKNYLFEFNDSETWNLIYNNIQPILENVKANRGISDYEIDVGADEYEIKTKRIHVNIVIRPMKTIERIELNFFIE